MEVMDPNEELTGEALRVVVERCTEYGRIVLAIHAGERMEERHITGGQILAALRGSLRTDSCVAGKWRYIGRKNDIEVCFTFDVDDEGNLLVIITLMRTS
jgi:hypothetical protein